MTFEQLWHDLLHKLGQHRGTVVTCTHRGTIWMAFRCAECNRVFYKRPAFTPPDSMFSD